VEAEVQGKMKVQDTLEVTEIQAFSPHLYLRVSFPMTTISSCKTILSLTKLAWTNRGQGQDQDQGKI